MPGISRAAKARSIGGQCVNVAIMRKPKGIKPTYFLRFFFVGKHIALISIPYIEMKGEYKIKILANNQDLSCLPR